MVTIVAKGLEPYILEVKIGKDFADENDFVHYAYKQSVFAEYELCQWYRTKLNFILSRWSITLPSPQGDMPKDFGKR